MPCPLALGWLQVPAPCLQLVDLALARLAPCLLALAPCLPLAVLVVDQTATRHTPVLNAPCLLVLMEVATSLHRRQWAALGQILRAKLQLGEALLLARVQ